MQRLTRTGGAILLSSTLVIGGLGSNLHQRARAAAANDVLIYGSSEEPDTLNPNNTVLTTAFNVDSAVFDTLISPDPHNVFRPDLATSYEHSADGRSWTFHLRHDVKWADGVPFTSADVAYTYHALLDKKHNTFSTTGWDKIDRFSTPDPYTFAFHLKQVFAPLLAYIGYQNAIIPEHIYNKPGFDYNKAPFNRTPLGTGPYMVSEWKTADHITLVPNPYSWRGQPFFKKIIYKIVPSDNTKLVQLQTGDLDMGAVTQAQYSQAKGIAGKHVDVSDGNSWFHIDLKQWGFLRDKAVRQALDYATPKQAILKEILKGLGQVAYADLDPSFTYYYNPNVPKHPFNLARAAALLASDGLTKGPGGVLQKNGQPFEMELWNISSDSLGERINTVLKNLWEKLGIKVTLRNQGTNTIFGAGGPQYTKKMTGIDYAWTNGDDPDDSFYWNSSQIQTSPTSSGGNDVGYFYKFDFQKQIDDLTNAGEATLDTAKRRSIYFQVQSLLADEVPVIFIDWQPALYVVPNNIVGFKANPFNNLFWNVVEWRRQ